MSLAQTQSPPPRSALRVLELYSGIGGMHYALKMSGINAQVVAAVDINHHANLVYQHNFKETRVIQKTIEVNEAKHINYLSTGIWLTNKIAFIKKLLPNTTISTLKGIKLDEYNKLDVDIILMSPPCQPYTRQGNQSGLLDNRSQSFKSVIELIPQLNKKPKFILIENVKGFDESHARTALLDMLRGQNYVFQEFLLSPIQFGIPNSRLRYFLIARLGSEPFAFTNDDGKIFNMLPPLDNELREWVNRTSAELSFDLSLITRELRDPGGDADVATARVDDNDLYDKDKSACATIKRTQLNENFRSCCNSSSMCVSQSEVRSLAAFVSEEMGTNANYQLGAELFRKSAAYIDLVSVDSTRTSCFTKNYGRYLEGTGSILLLGKKHQQRQQSNVERTNTIADDDDLLSVNCNAVRFLTAKEIANLHCFPNEFEFPSELSAVQKWRLIGNSLNVLNVAVLIRLMIK